MDTGDVIGFVLGAVAATIFWLLSRKKLAKLHREASEELAKLKAKVGQ